MIRTPSKLAQYEELSELNYSRLRLLEESPLALHHRLLADREAQTPHMRRGSAVHCLVLEAERFTDRYCVWPGAKRGKRWEAFREAHRGLSILTALEHEVATELASAVRRFPPSSRLISLPGAREDRLHWRGPHDLPLAGTPDLVTEGGELTDSLLVGLKTTGLSWRQWHAYAARTCLHAQAAMYADGLAALGRPVAAVFEIVVQAKPPHDVAVFELDEGVLDLGRAKYRSWLDTVIECVESGRWPGAYPSVSPLQLPAWAFTEDDPVELTIGGERLTL